jgi:hypothetical protein
VLSELSRAAAVVNDPAARRQVAQAALKLCAQCDHAEFLLPVLSWLEKDEVLAMLPRLTQPAGMELALQKLLSLRQPPLSPAELLEHVHYLPDLKRAKATTQFLFKDSARVARRDVLEAALNALLSNPAYPRAPPQLFMFTLMKAMAVCPPLVKTGVRMLADLIPRRLWEDKKLWEGFEKCLKDFQPETLPVSWTSTHEITQRMTTCTRGDGHKYARTTDIFHVGSCR